MGTGLSESLRKSVEDVAKRWGGSFRVEFTGSWRKTLAEFAKKGFFSVHLTMYGMALQKEAKALRSKKRVLLKSIYSIINFTKNTRYVHNLSRTKLIQIFSWPIP